MTESAGGERRSSECRPAPLSASSPVLHHLTGELTRVTVDDLIVVAAWLRGSILGIILLGAVGSLLATVLLAAARKVLLDIIPDRYLSVRKHLRKREYCAGYVLGALA